MRSPRSVHAKLNCVDCHAAMAEMPHPRARVRIRPRAHRRAGRASAAGATSPTTPRRSTACTRPRWRAAIGPRRSASTATARTTSRSRPRRARSSRRPAPSATAASPPPTRRACTAAPSRRATPTCPVCTDCHRAHDIAGPRTTAWELRTPEMCGALPHQHGDDGEVRAVDQRPRDVPLGLPRQDGVAPRAPGHGGHRARSWRGASTATASTTSRRRAIRSRR